MKKQVVIVTVWSDTEQKQIKIVAGEFTRYIDAKLFAEAYEARYQAKPIIAEIAE